MELTVTDSLLWRIGSSESPSTDLYDNFRQPDALGAVEWVAGQPGQRWPMFHASEADPEGGYRLHPYCIRFALTGAPAARANGSSTSGSTAKRAGPWASPGSRGQRPCTSSPTTPSPTEG